MLNTKHHRYIIFNFLLLYCVSLYAANFTDHDYYSVCFTPAQKCRRKITNDIYHAKNTIEVQAYSFTAKAIAYALIKAQQRGVKVRVLVDKAQLLNPSRLHLLLRHHVSVWLDSQVAIAHNKVMIFDHKAVLTGSYNFTNAAEYKNAENSLFIFAPSLAAKYYANWQSRLTVSQPLSLHNLDRIKRQLQSTNRT